MAGYVIIGALAAFGLMCVIWIGCGAALPDSRKGLLLLSAPLDEETLNAVRRWIWLREMGLLYTPMAAVDDGLEDAQRSWLEGQGFIIYSRAELARKLGIGENRIDTGTGDLTGRHQCGGVPEL